MPYNIEMPDGTLVEDIPDSLDPVEAKRRILAARPELRGKGAGPKSGFLPAMKAGWENLKGDVAGLAGRTGLMSIVDAEAQQARNKKAAADIYKPTEGTWFDSPGAKFAETLGGSVPYMAAPVVAGGAAAFAGAPALAAAGAAGLTSAAQFTGSNLAAQQDTGKKLADTDLTSAAAAAVPQALLDVVGFKMIPGIRRIFAAAGKELTPKAAAEIAKAGLKSTVADYAKSGIKASGVEGLTEAGQQVFERLQAGLALNDEAAREEYLQNFLGGAVLGGALSVPGRFHERGRGREQLQAAQIEEQKQIKAEQDAAALEQQQAAQKQAQRQDPAYAQKITDQYNQLYAQHQAMLPGKLGAAATGADKLENEAQQAAADQFYEDNLKELEVEAAAVRPALKAIQEQKFQDAQEKAQATTVSDSGEAYDAGQGAVQQMTAERDVLHQQQAAAVKQALEAAKKGDMATAKAAQEQAAQLLQRAKLIDKQLGGRQVASATTQLPPDNQQQIDRLTKQYGVAVQSGEMGQAEALRVELEKLHAAANEQVAQQQRGELNKRLALERTVAQQQRGELNKRLALERTQPSTQLAQVESEEQPAQDGTTPAAPAAAPGWRPRETPALDSKINARQPYLPKDPVLPPNQRQGNQQATGEMNLTAPPPQGQQEDMFGEAAPAQDTGPEALRAQIAKLKLRPGMPANTQASLDRMDALLQRDDLPRMAFEDIKEQVYRVANLGEGSAARIDNRDREGNALPAADRKQLAEMLARKQQELNGLRQQRAAWAGDPSKDLRDLSYRIQQAQDEMGRMARTLRADPLTPAKQVLTPRQDKQPVFVPQPPTANVPSGLTKAQRDNPVPTEEDIGKQANKENKPHNPGYTGVGEVGYVPANPRTVTTTPASTVGAAPMSPAAMAEAEEGSDLGNTPSAPIERAAREDVAPADPKAIGSYTPVQKKRSLGLSDQGTALELERDIEERMARLSPKDQQTLDFWDKEYGVDSPVGKAVREAEEAVTAAEAELDKADTQRRDLATALFKQKQDEEARNAALRHKDKDAPGKVRDVAGEMVSLDVTDKEIREAQALVERRQAALAATQNALNDARARLEDAMQGAALFNPNENTENLQERVDKAVEELLPLLQTAFPTAANDPKSAEAIRDAFSEIVSKDDLTHQEALDYLDNRRLFKKGFGDAFGPQVRDMFETIVRLKAVLGVTQRLRTATEDTDTAQRQLPIDEQRLTEAQRASAEKAQAPRSQGAALEAPRGKSTERTAAEQRVADANKEVDTAREKRDAARQAADTARATRADVIETVEALRKGDTAPLVKAVTDLQARADKLSAELDKVHQSMEAVQGTVDADTARLLQDPAAWEELQAQFDFLADVAAGAPLSPLAQTRAVGLVEATRRADELSTRAELKKMYEELERLRKTYAQAQLEKDRKAEKYAKDEFDALVKKMQNLRDDQELRGMEGGTEAGDVKNSPAMTYAQAVADQFVSLRQDLMQKVNALRERIDAVNRARPAAEPFKYPEGTVDKSVNPYAGVSAGLDSVAAQLVQKPPELSSRMTGVDRDIEQREAERNAGPEMAAFIERINNTEKRGALNKERGALVVERDNWIEKADTANIVSQAGRVILPGRAADLAGKQSAEVVRQVTAARKSLFEAQQDDDGSKGSRDRIEALFKTISRGGQRLRQLSLPDARRGRIAVRRSLIAEKARIVQAKIDIIDAQLERTQANPRISPAEQVRTEEQADKRRAQTQRRVQGSTVRNAQTPSSYLRTGAMEGRKDRQGGTRQKTQETSTVAQPSAKQAVAAGNAAAQARGVQQIDAAKQKEDLKAAAKQKMADLQKQLNDTRAALEKADKAANKGSETHAKYVQKLRETEEGLVRDLAIAQRSLKPYNDKTEKKAKGEVAVPDVDDDTVVDKVEATTPKKAPAPVATPEPQQAKPGSQTQSGAGKKAKPAVFRTATNTGAGMKAAEVTRLADRIVEGWTNTPPITVVDNEAALPQRLQDQAAADGMTGKVPGLFDPDTGTVYLVAENLHTGNDVALTIAHEVAGHYGLRDMMGTDYASTMNRLYNGNTAIRKEADAKMKASPNLSQEVAVEEALADMAESGNPSAIRQIYQAVKAWLAKALGLRGVSDKEVQQIVANARQHVQEGTARGTGAGGQAVYRAAKASPYAVASVFAQPRSFKDRMGGNLALAAEMHTVDMRAPVREALATGNKRLAEQAMYYIRKNDARMPQVYSVFQHGALGLKQDARGRYVVEAGNSKSVQDVFKAIAALPGKDAQDKMTTAQAYLTAKRALANPKAAFALDLGKGGLTPEVLAADMRKLTADPKQKEALENIARVYADLNRGLIDFLKETGAISKDEAADYVSDDSYVPYYRVRGDGVAELVFDETKTLRLGDIRTQPYLKALEGGDAQLLPLNEAITRNVMLLTDMGMRNLTTKNVAYALQDIGKPTKKMQIRTGDGKADVKALRFKQDGKPYHIIVDTEGTPAEGIPGDMVARSLEGSYTVIPSFRKAFGWAGDVLRAGVTRNPMYVARQLFRDPFAASFTGGLERGPLTAVAKAMAAFVRQTAGRKDATAEALVRKGVVQSGIFSGDPDDLSKMSLQLAGGDSGAFNKLFSAMDRAAMRADSVTRQQMYDDVLKRTGSEMEAEMAAMEMMNFSKRGLSPTVQYASRMIPFFNAQIQGLNVLHKAITGKATMQERLGIQQKFWDRAGMLMAGTLIYAMAMEDDDTYKNARASDRYANWFVPLSRDPANPKNDVTLKLPIPFEVGLLMKAVPEALIDYMRGTSSEQEWKAIRNLFLNQIPGGSSFMLPQLAKPLIEVGTNHSFFTGREIEGAAMKGVDPQERYTARTTELAKRMSEMLQSDLTPDALKLSPLQIEHLARGYLGSLPIIAAATMNDVFGTPNAEAPTRKLTETPLYGTSFQDRYGNGAADILYAKIKAADQVQTTYNKMINEGRKQDAKMYLADVENLRELPMLRQAESKLQLLAKQEKAIRSSANLDPDTKRERLDAITARREQESRKYLDAVAAVAR